jgi:hypothetical protein
VTRGLSPLAREWHEVVALQQDREPDAVVMELASFAPRSVASSITSIGCSASI